jgi:hypothetical protein
MEIFMTLRMRLILVARIVTATLVVAACIRYAVGHNPLFLMVAAAACFSLLLLFLNRTKGKTVPIEH